MKHFPINRRSDFLSKTSRLLPCLPACLKKSLSIALLVCSLLTAQAGNGTHLMANGIAASPKNDPPVTSEKTPLYLHGFSIQGSRTYDGTTSIQITSTGTLNTQQDGSGEAPEGDVHIDDSGASASVSTPDADSGKEVTIAGITLSGDGSENYELVLPAGLTTTITPGALQHDGQMSVHDKPYDGTTHAEINEWGGLVTAGIIDGDEVSLLEDPLVTTAFFEDAEEGENKNVYVYNLALTGAHSHNYVLSSPPLPPGHGGGDDFSPPQLILFASITQAVFAHILITGPSSLTAGETSTSFTLWAQDSFGNPVVMEESTLIVLSSSSGSTGEAIAFTPPTITLEEGMSSATFTHMDQKAGTHTITASVSAAGREQISGSAIIAVNHAAASRLRFVHQPTETVAGEPIAPPVSVRIEDPFGNTATSNDNTISLSLYTNPFKGTGRIDASRGPVTLKGTLSKPALAGVADFDDLYVERAGLGYRIDAISASLTSAQSDDFNILAAPTHELIFSIHPLTYTAGDPRIKYTLLRRDPFGNHVTSGEMEAYLYHDSGPEMAAFYESELGGEPVQSISIPDGHPNHSFWYADKQAGSRLVTASHNAEGPDGEQGIHDATHILPVSPRPLSIRVGDHQRIYGEEGSGYAFNDFRGHLMEGDNVAHITGGEGTAVDVEYESISTAATPVGSHPADIGILSSSLNGERAGSYSIGIIRGMTTITPRAMSLGGSLSAHDKTYDGNTQAAVGLEGLILEGKVPDDEVDLVNVHAAFAGSGTGTHDVHLTAADISGPHATNYSFSLDDAPKASAEIIAAPLTITADDQSKVWDDAVFPPEDYTVSYEGFVAGEGPAVLDGILEFGGPAITATDAGTHTITASGLTAGNYQITYVDGILQITEKSLHFHVQPVQATAGEVIGGAGEQALVIHILDDNGDILEEANDVVSIALRDNPTGASLHGTLSKTATEGVVVFDDLLLYGAGEDYSLRVTAPLVNSATSIHFPVAATEAHELLFTEAPHEAVAGVASLAFSLELWDEYGNPTGLHEGFNDIISIAGGAGTLIPAQVDMEAGSTGVSFAWHPPVEAATYTMTLDAGPGFDTLEHGIEILHAPASRWHFDTPPPASAVAGEAFEPSAVIHITDEYGNLATSHGGMHFLASLGEEASGPLVGNPVAPVQGGIAAFGDLSYEVAESIILSFACSNPAILPDKEEGHTIDVQAGMPASISLLQHPQHPSNNFDAGQVLSPAPLVRVRDAFGNPVPAVSVDAVINKPSFAPDAVTQVESDAGGQAAFEDLAIATAGNDFHIHFETQAGDEVLASDAFVVNVRPSTPATTAIIAGPTATIPQRWSGNYSMILLDEFNNETYALGNMVFAMASSSGNHSFRSGRGGDIMVPSGQKSTTFQYKDQDVGQQTITASWDYEEVVKGTCGISRGKGLPVFEDAMYQVEVSDQWVWVAREGQGYGNDWNDLNNWNQEEGSPDSENIVYIRNFHSDISPRIKSGQDVNIGTLVVESGLAVHLAPGASLSVGSFVLDSSSQEPAAYLESDASGAASLINDDEGVYALVEKYIGGSSYSWHMLSAPVKDQRIDGGASSDFSDGGFFAWHEPMQGWVDYGDDSHVPAWSQVHSVGGVTNTFIPARGYALAQAFDEGQNPTMHFLGELGARTHAHTLSHYAHPEDPHVGFNLVGNPYPSSIDWQATEGWQGREHLAGDGELGGYNMWIWNPEAGNYGVFNTLLALDDLPPGWELNGVSNVIPPMQAFWVRVASELSHGSGLSMDSRVRVHGGPQEGRRRGGVLSRPSLHLSLSLDGTTMRDEALVQFSHAGEPGGASKMFSLQQEAPGIYLPLDEGDGYSIFLADCPHAMGSLPLAVQAGISSSHTLRIRGVDSFDRPVWLSDLHLGQLIPLHDDFEYSFFASPGDCPGRFLLVFGEDADPGDDITGLGETFGDRPLIYHSSGHLHVHNPWPSDAMVEVFGSCGRLVDAFVVPTGLAVRETFSAPSSVYAVRMRSSEGQHAVKIVL